MKKISLRRIEMVICGVVSLILGDACEKEDITRSQDGVDESQMINKEPGISFDLESDSLEEDIDELFFESKDRGEDEMG